jgi:hypothetical protein
VLSDSELVPQRRLSCIECGALSESDANGWRAYIAYVEEDGEPPEIAI